MSNSDSLRTIVHQSALEWQNKGQTAYPRYECAGLPIKALEKANAKDNNAFGPYDKREIYKWGTPIELNAAQPGDILQFQNHRVTISKEQKFVLKNNSILSEYILYDERTYNRGHHSAIVHSTLRDGKMIVLETHVKHESGKDKNMVDFGTIYVGNKSPEITSSNIKITITEDWANKLRNEALKSKQNYMVKQVNKMLELFKGKQIDAYVTTKTKIEVSGIINAYSPIAK